MHLTIKELIFWTKTVKLIKFVLDMHNADVYVQQ